MENLILLDKDFNMEYVIDVFESLIWTVRYKEAGDFELYTPISEDVISKFAVGKYLLNDSFWDKTLDKAHLMIIESLELDETHLKITGRDLKSILSRRIVWGRKIVEKNTNVHDIIKNLVTEAFISPIEPQDVTNPYTHEVTDRSAQRSARILSSFVFDNVDGTWESTDEDINYDNQNLLEAIEDLCSKFKIGYEVLFKFSDKRFHMQLIKPVDRSWNQTKVPPVVFSAEFGNLASSKYLESVENYKNVAFVRGMQETDDEIDKFTQTAIFGDASGLDRREVYIDASDLAKTDDTGTIKADYDTYQNMIEEKGRSEMSKRAYSHIKSYEGEADNAADQYEFMKDYKIGDMVEIVTSYGMGNIVRISEMVLSLSTSGHTLVPTFESIEEDDE